MTAPTPDPSAVAARLSYLEEHPRLTATPTDLHSAVAALATVTAERDQARQMLADAPHGHMCEVAMSYGTKCCCWKAGL